MHMITPLIPKLSLNKSKTQVKTLVVILLTSSKSKKHLSLLKIHTNRLSKYILTCLFYLCMSIFLSIYSFVNVKTL